MEQICQRIERMKARQVRELGYTRVPDGSITLPGWGPVTEDAKRMAALPAEIWEEAGRRRVLPRPDGTVPDGWGLRIEEA